jgi:pimeloyl-ACP methyl ester carboxylesterase
MSVPRQAGLPDGVEPVRLDGPAGPVAALVSRPRQPGFSTVLCVPGYTGSKEDFAPLLPLLAAAGHETVAIDLRGQYESVGSDDPAAYRRDALAAEVSWLVDRLGSSVGPPHLVAHSYGGIVARAAVLAGSVPASLTLLGSGPAGIVGNRRVLIELMEPILAEGGIEAVWAAAESLNAADPRQVNLPTEVKDFLARRFLAASPVGMRVMGEDLRDEPDRVEELAAAGVPLLVAHGAGDDAWPPALQAEMAQRLRAAYAVIPDALHSPAVENPGVTAEVLLGFWEARRD